MTERNRATVAAEWAARGFGCELWVDPPGRRRERNVGGTMARWLYGYRRG